MTTTRIASISMLIALSTIATTRALQGGFQSGPSPGPFYSGGMVFIPGGDRALLTGAHYNKGIIQNKGTKDDQLRGTDLDTASSCYLAKVNFDDVETDGSYSSLSDWISFGNEAKIETCSAVTSNKLSDIFVVGSVGAGGLFSDGYPMQGLLSILNSETLEFVDATLIKSAQDPSKHMIYPLDVIHEYGRKFIYIAALTSTDAQENSITNQDHPNWQEQHLLGSAFDVTVIKIHAPDGEKPEAMWVQHFPLDIEPDGTTPPVFVAGMSLHKDSNGVEHLLVSGSTRGSGEAFGKVAAGTIDEDGFVMQLDLHDGSFLKHSRHKGSDYDYVADLREGTQSDDFIRGMCNNRGRGHEDAAAADHFYIVGGTKGDMTTNAQGTQNLNDSGGFQFGPDVDAKYKDTWDRSNSLMPFLRQVRIDDLKPEWTTQWAAMPSNPSSKSIPTNAFAMDCYLDNVGAIYVVGSVLGGAQMAQGDVEMMSQGGDDIWVAKIDEKTGNVFWLTQLGTGANEKLARHGSIAVKRDTVMIYGDTSGSMYRMRDGGEDPDTTDFFLMSLDVSTGAVLDEQFMGGTSSATVSTAINGVPPVIPTVTTVPPKGNAPTMAPRKPPTAAPVEVEKPTEAPVKSPTAAPIRSPKAPSATKETSSALNSDSSVGGGGLIFIILMAVAGTMGIAYFICNRNMKKRKAESQKSSIFSCLQQFDVEDIDLRRSPPGGWHGTYMNKLAYGHNNADDTVNVVGAPEGAPLTHSSVANDALFMEDSGGYKDNNFAIDDDDEVDIRLNAKTEIV